MSVFVCVVKQSVSNRIGPFRGMRSCWNDKRERKKRHHYGVTGPEMNSHQCYFGSFAPLTVITIALFIFLSFLFLALTARVLCNVFFLFFCFVFSVVLVFDVFMNHDFE